jgi:MFS family permease
VTAVALPLAALTTLDASNFEIGLLTAAAYAATVLVGLPAGVIVQHFPLRGMQVFLDVFRALAVASIPVVALWDLLTFPHLLLVAFLVGLAGNLFDVANATFLPQVVPTAELTRRNSLISGTQATTELGGPAIGGLLVQFVGAVTSIVVDAITYLVSAVLLQGIPAAGRPAATAERTGFRRQIRDGLGYVLRHPVIRPCVVAATAVNFANGAILAVTPPFLLRTLDLPAASVGLVLAVDGLGAVIGAFLTTRLVRGLGSARTLLVATSVGSLLGLAMPAATTSWAMVIFCVGIAGLAAGVSVLSVVTRTHRQTVSPPHLLSRVMASVRFISWGATPIGAVVAGTVSQLWGPRYGLLVAVAVTFVAPVALLLSRVRHLHELTDDEPLAAADPAAGE